MSFRMRDHWSAWLLLLLASVGVVAYALAARLLHEAGFPLDDSWIHQTYARNLAEHMEWAFIPGEASAASTSPLYTVLLSIGYVLRLPSYIWTNALGIVALTAGAWQASRLAQVMFPNYPFVGIWTGLAVVLSWHLVWAAASGMETMQFAALSLFVIGLAWREVTCSDCRTRRDEFLRGLSLGVVGALLTLTRPEGVGLVALSGLLVLAAWPYSSRAEWRHYLLWGMGAVLGWLAFTAPYLALNYHVSGGLLPDTSAAKQAENAPALALPVLERYGRMLLPLVAGVQLMLLPGLIAAFVQIVRQVRQRRRSVVFILPLVWAFVLVSAYVLRLPAPYQHGRYVIPIVPVLLLYGVGGTLSLIRAGAQRATTRVLTRSLGLSAVLLALAFWWVGAKTYARDVRIINTEMVDAAHWVEENLLPGELLAVHDIGALGYYAPRPILDLAGLVTPEIVPYLGDPEAVMRFMCEHDVAYMMVLPDQLPTRDDDARLGGSPVFSTGAPYAP